MFSGLFQDEIKAFCQIARIIDEVRLVCERESKGEAVFGPIPRTLADKAHAPIRPRLRRRIS